MNLNVSVEWQKQLANFNMSSTTKALNTKKIQYSSGDVLCQMFYVCCHNYSGIKQDTWLIYQLYTCLKTYTPLLLHQGSIKHDHGLINIPTCMKDQLKSSRLYSTQKSICFMNDVKQLRNINDNFAFTNIPCTSRGTTNQVQYCLLN